MKNLLRWVGSLLISMLKHLTGSSIKQIPFLRLSLTPLNSNQVYHYLHDNPDEALKWDAFIEGSAKISMKDIGKMDAPELSVLSWALKRRFKEKKYLFSGRLANQ